MKKIRKKLEERWARERKNNPGNLDIGISKLRLMKRQSVQMLFNPGGIIDEDEKEDENNQLNNQDIIDEILRIKTQTTVNFTSLHEKNFRRQYDYVKSKYFDIYKKNKEDNNTINNGKNLFF